MPSLALPLPRYREWFVTFETQGVAQVLERHASARLAFLEEREQGAAHAHGVADAEARHAISTGGDAEGDETASQAGLAPSPAWRELLVAEQFALAAARHYPDVAASHGIVVQRDSATGGQEDPSTQEDLENTGEQAYHDRVLVGTEVGRMKSVAALVSEYVLVRAEASNLLVDMTKVATAMMARGG